MIKFKAGDIIEYYDKLATFIEYVPCNNDSCDRTTGDGLCHGRINFYSSELITRSPSCSCNLKGSLFKFIRHKTPRRRTIRLRT